MSGSDPKYYTSLERFRATFTQGTPILTYHVVGPRPWGTKMKGLYVSPRLFERQLAELREAGHTTPPFDAIVGPASSEARQVFLTMDDATRKAAEHALPILARQGCRAIQYVVAGRIGGINDWQTAKGEVEEPLMNAAEIRAWLDAGHAIGAHTMSHPWLTRIPQAQAREEITASKKALEDRFGRRIDHFCYPYGDYNEAVTGLVGEAGYRTACTTESGVNTPDTPRLGLKRIMARYQSRNLRSLWASFRRGG